MNRLFFISLPVWVALILDFGQGFTLGNVKVQTFSYGISEEGPLLLDIRIPNKALNDVPGVIFVHGGGFMSGTRDSAPVGAFLDSLAALGITSASISYRLTRKGKGFGCNVSVVEKRTAVHEAAVDLISALDWLNAQEMNLPKAWVAVGSSAGAETAMWAGYGLAPEKWAGIIAFSGALEQGTPVPVNAPPLLAIHGECDAVVPPYEAVHRGCSEQDVGAWNLCGGPCWAEILDSRGYSACAWTQCGAGHEMCTSAMLRPDVQQWMVKWLQNPDNSCTSQLLDPDGIPLPQGSSPCPHPCSAMD